MTDEELREKMACPGGYRPSIEEVNLLSVEIDRLRAALSIAQNLEALRDEENSVLRAKNSRLRTEILAEQKRYMAACQHEKELEEENALLLRVAEAAEAVMNEYWKETAALYTNWPALRKALDEWRNRGEG